jgi:hypothetical protein
VVRGLGDWVAVCPIPYWFSWFARGGYADYEDGSEFVCLTDRFFQRLTLPADSIACAIICNFLLRNH